jgi:uncharacterized protein YrrD
MQEGTMDVSLGADVTGSDGRSLGTIKAVIADARIDRVTELVVKHGLLGGRQWAVPLVHIQRVEGGTVHLDLDEDTLKTMSGVSGPLRGADSDYTGTPSTDAEGSFQGDLQMDSMVAIGAQGPAGKVGGFPGGEQLTPDFMDRPSIYSGIDVLDALGDKVGELDDFSFAHDTGAPTRVTMKRGFLFLRSETEIPIAWVKDLTDDGILLNVPGSEVKDLVARHGN